MFRIAFLINS